MTKLRSAAEVTADIVVAREASDGMTQDITAIIEARDKEIVERCKAAVFESGGWEDVYGQGLADDICAALDAVLKEEDDEAAGYERGKREGALEVLRWCKELTCDRRVEMANLQGALTRRIAELEKESDHD